MPQIRGLVQRIQYNTVAFPNSYLVYIGPTPTNTVLLYVALGGFTAQDPAGILRRTSMIGALSGAQFSRREVIVTHPTNNTRIMAVEVPPG